jgi:hypothetical protein
MTGFFLNMMFCPAGFISFESKASFEAQTGIVPIRAALYRTGHFSASVSGIFIGTFSDSGSSE